MQREQNVREYADMIGFDEIEELVEEFTDDGLADWDEIMTALEETEANYLSRIRHFSN